MEKKRDVLDSRGRHFAFCVVNSKYKFLERLTYSEKYYGERMKSVLKDELHFADVNVLLDLDKTWATDILRDWFKHIETKHGRLGAMDTVVIYFGGHGRHDEEDFKMFGIDFGSRRGELTAVVALDALKENLLLRLSRCPIKAAFIIVDSCRTFDEPPYVGTVPGETFVERETPRTVRSETIPTVPIYTFFTCQMGKHAYRIDEDSVNSLFVEALVAVVVEGRVRRDQDDRHKPPLLFSDLLDNVGAKLAEISLERGNHYNGDRAWQLTQLTKDAFSRPPASLNAAPPDDRPSTMPVTPNREGTDSP